MSHYGMPVDEAVLADVTPPPPTQVYF